MARVQVIGTGAVGGYFGACLQRAGHDVTFVARGRNLEALRTDGLRVTGAMGDFDLPSVTATDEPAGECDLALLCVKAYDLPAAAEHVGPVGTVLTLQNGVDAPDVAASILGDRVLAGTTGIVADLPEPGHVHVVSAYAWIRFGEPRSIGVTDRVSSVAEILDVEGIQVHPAEDARLALWEKMALMCGMAGLTTLHQRPVGEILTGDLRGDFEAIVAECAAVATAEGVAIGPDFVSDRMRYADRIDPAAMSSMSRDAARGRRIELETFNGAVVRKGAELDVDVPCNRAVYDALRHMTPS